VPFNTRIDDSSAARAGGKETAIVQLVREQQSIKPRRN